MIELQKLISDKIEEYLNASIKKEMESATIYYGMAVWLNKVGYDYGYELFKKFGDEELKHAKQLEEYIDNRNCTAVIPVISKPAQTFSTCKQVIETAYQHEIDIENNYKVLCTMAIREGDFTTFHLAQHFINEQVEEVDKFLSLINLININEDNSNLPALLEEAFEELLS